MSKKPTPPNDACGSRKPHPVNVGTEIKRFNGQQNGTNEEAVGWLSRRIGPFFVNAQGISGWAWPSAEMRNRSSRHAPVAVVQPTHHRHRHPYNDPTKALVLVARPGRADAVNVIPGTRPIVGRGV